MGPSKQYFWNYIKTENSAFTNVRHYFAFQSTLPTPSPYFKLGTVLYVNDNEIRIKMSTKLPIGNCGDGVSVNQKAARILKDVYGMSTLDFRCSSHATDGSLKRIAKSESMSVEEVKSLYLSLRSVVKHFHCSVKSKELLDKALEMVEIEKGIHLISWCSTRIGHFLTAGGEG